MADPGRESRPVASGPAQSISTAVKAAEQTLRPSIDSPAQPSRGRRLTVTFVNASCAFVTGYGSRELLTELRGRPPVWSSLSRGWVAMPRTARDLVAVAESRGYDVTVTDGDPGGGRW